MPITLPQASTTKNAFGTILKYQPRFWQVVFLLIGTVFIIFSARAQTNRPAHRMYTTNTCTGSLGDPILYETFGHGEGFGAALSSSYSNLGYQAATCPTDGNYSIVNYTSGCWAQDVVWHTTIDHTGDANGYFMLVNASYTPSDFYMRIVDNLCAGTSYQFGAWLLNMCSVTGTLPNVTFSMETINGLVLASMNTGDIKITNPALWKQYTLNFTMPAGTSTVLLRMRNNAPGGVGNDVALDDISFRPIGPQTTIQTNYNTGDTIRVCNRGVDLVSTVEACYLSNSYQWQSSHDAVNWTNIPTQTTLNYTVPANSNNDTNYYRLLVAQQGNIDVSTCRVNSNVVTVISGAPVAPALVDTAVTLCKGGVFVFRSGKTVSTTGNFRDTVPNRFGCDSLVTNLQLTVFSPALINTTATICDGGSYVLPSGKIATTTGVYADTLRKTNGCDSVINTVTLSVITAAGNSFTVNTCVATGYTLPSGLAVNRPGIYLDTVKSSLGCDSIHSAITVNYIMPVNQNMTAYICAGQNFTTPGGDTISTPGLYKDTLHTQTGCDSIIYTINVLVSSATALQNGYQLPGAFTPNGDGLNDCFGISSWGTVSNLRFSIFNRWGQRVFYSSGTSNCWDGTFQGRLQPQDTYVYYISAETPCGKINRKGVVVLVK